jgi:hypothetical protein
VRFTRMAFESPVFRCGVCPRGLLLVKIVA